MTPQSLFIPNKQQAKQVNHFAGLVLLVYTILIYFFMFSELAWQCHQLILYSLAINTPFQFIEIHISLQIMTLYTIRKRTSSELPPLIPIHQVPQPRKRGLDQLADLLNSLRLSQKVLRRVSPMKVKSSLQAMVEEKTMSLRRKQILEQIEKNRLIHLKIEQGRLERDDSSAQPGQDQYYVLEELEQSQDLQFDTLQVDSKVIYPCLEVDSDGELRARCYQEEEENESIDSNHEDFEGNEYPSSSEGSEEEWGPKGWQRKKQREFDFERDF